MRVFVIGPDKTENTGVISQALQASGHTLVHAAQSLSGVREKLATLRAIDLNLQPEAVLVLADSAARGSEAALLEPLADWPVVVLLKTARRDQEQTFLDLQAACLRGVLKVPPYDFSGLAQMAQARPSPAETSVSTSFAVQAASSVGGNAATRVASVAVQPAGYPLRRQLRFGLYGARGGVGVSTAIAQIAKAIAAQNRAVGIFDSTRRGDVHFLFGAEPQESPITVGLITLFMGAPDEQQVRLLKLAAVLVDGGRRRGNFNAEWLRLEKPLTEQEIARWSGTQESAPILRKGWLSIEVTE